MVNDNRKKKNGNIYCKLSNVAAILFFFCGFIVVPIGHDRVFVKSRITDKILRRRLMFDTLEILLKFFVKLLMK